MKALSNSNVRYLASRLVKELKVSADQAEEAVRTVAERGSTRTYDDALALLKESLPAPKPAPQRVRTPVPPKEAAPPPPDTESVPFDPDYLRVRMPDETILRVVRLPDDYIKRSTAEWEAKVRAEQEANQQATRDTQEKARRLTQRLAHAVAQPDHKPVML